MKNNSKYEKLSSKEKIVLQVIALLGTSPSIDILSRILKNFSSVKFLRGEISTIFNKLLREKFFRYHYGCVEEYRDKVIGDAVTASYFDDLSSAIWVVVEKTLTYYSDRVLLNLAVLRKDEESYLKFGKEQERLTPFFMTKSGFTYNLCSELPFAWQKTLPPIIMCHFLDDLGFNQILDLKAIPSKWTKIFEENLHSCSESYLVRKQWANIHLLKGDIQYALAISEEDYKEKRPYSFMLRGISLLLQRNIDAAWKYFSEGIKAYHRIDRKDCFEDFYAFFALTCLLLSKEKNRYTRFERLLKQVTTWNDPYARFCTTLSVIEDLSKNNIESAHDFCSKIIDVDSYPIIEFLVMVICFWVSKTTLLDLNDEKMEHLYEHCLVNGYPWVSSNIYKICPDITFDHDISEDNRPLIVDVMQIEAQWKRSLQMISEFLEQGSLKEKRLVWFIDMEFSYSFCAREQKKRANGTWTKGKLLHSLYDNRDYFTDQDRSIIESMHNEYDFESSWERTLLKMIGHPLVFWEQSPDTRVDIVKEFPYVTLEKVNNEYIFAFSHAKSHHENIICIRDRNKIRVVCLNDRQCEVLRLMGRSLTLPETAKKELKTVTKLITQEIDILSTNTDMGNVRSSTTSTKIYVRFDKIMDDNYVVDFVVKPFAEEVFSPGKGTTAFFDAQHKNYVTRDVKEEIIQANKILSKCDLKINDTWSWNVNTGGCLQLLLKWKDIVEIEWLREKKLQVRSIGNMSFKITQKEHWFELSSKIEVDEKRVWDIKKLLKSLDGKNYIKLNDESFTVITEELRGQLETLASCVDKDHLHKALLPNAHKVLSEFEEVDFAKEWQKQISTIEKIQQHKANLPKDFCANLRPYQKEGFLWLSRLEKWGVGACLADDMGLGKTIQALAILLKSARKGASLVVAPTSVCINWAVECKRFTPSLTPYVFNSQSQNSMIKNVKANDLLITSYGMLQNREEVFRDKKWNIVVLDEAQSIKNIHAKRTQAALKLESKFRIITTGTPVENNLNDLWTLFHFINPGLLGSPQNFKKRFLIPIELEKSSEVTARLKEIVSPFILRRTKSEVLKDLPPKIEKVMYVDMSPEELNFYEALRQKSVERITDGDQKGGQKHIQILAEIMRLRRACCHPRLVHNDSKAESSKLQTFVEILEEVTGNGGKILVFSQFVDYLKMAEKIVKNNNISYHYLDGSTNQKQRQKLINNFQKGKVNVFLISLKAGGVGLNLTAANTVIHLDPWWNPAVEDQATDRAHRIGQKKIVTVYRLVTSNTIEQKIINLHDNKRDLASKILDGTNKPNKLDTKTLMKLLVD
ncbi:DEAD/DEAH box helicase [Candidatus Uabimicrobium sp. HlEnr_7]|uniref:DEAD/DEAH box helicase n=1 Tax=Candidatus Uabimicrobium helgolandensis TaxID=3095367 RepID=UPI003556F72C